MKTTFNKIQLLLAISLVFASCGKSKDDFDASGTFEATEVIVSSEATGRILSLNMEEGQTLTAGQIGRAHV